MEWLPGKKHIIAITMHTPTNAAVPPKNTSGFSGGLVANISGIFATREIAQSMANIPRTIYKVLLMTIS
jgi:hypothetical protein